MSSLFAVGQSDEHEGVSGGQVKEFGQRYRGRYHMPLLPGESGTKAGGDWVPYGLMSATNLAGAILDARELSVWEIQRVMMGLALREDLYEQVVFETNMARNLGADLEELRQCDDGKYLITRLEEIFEAAKTAVGANAAGVKGTNRHDVWEARAQTGLLLGTSKINRDIEALERLLDENGLERVPGLQERVVRNAELEAAGRFDDVLMSRKTGRLYMADLKTKRKQFYTWLEAWIQQYVYATADYMLSERMEGYLPGPRHYVDQQSAILLRMPSDGAPPFLSRVDLTLAGKWARLAKSVCDARSEARSVGVDALSVWTEEA